MGRLVVDDELRETGLLGTGVLFFGEKHVELTMSACLEA